MTDATSDLGSDRTALDRSATRSRILMFVAMVLAVVVVGVTLYLDARREAAAALLDFAQEQATLADAVAQGGDYRKMQEPAKTMVLERRADGILRRRDGMPVSSPVVEQAMARHDRTVTLSRPQAAAIGFPARTAVAGISYREGSTVAVVATALRVRDREKRAQNRLLLGIVLASVLVGSFGGIALRIQRKEHLLERELLVREKEKESEEKLARADKLATMGAFATGIAHEIATPLGVITQRTEMLAPRLASDERGARAAQSIIEQVDKIRGIIESFLGLARGEAPVASRLESRTLLDAAKGMVEHRFGPAEVTLVVDAGGDGWVSGDRRLLEQALVNLLLNACDASRPGQAVRLWTEVTEGRVCFCVEDHGVGISPEVAARATEPFFTTKPAGAGTGLGLAIVSEIAKHHQGRFVIRARPGGGTEARLELLAQAAPSKERAA